MDSRLVVLTMAAFVLIGCQQTVPEAVYFQPENSTAVINDTINMDAPVKLCNISGTDYYVIEPFIYVETEMNRSIVMTYVGTYMHDIYKDSWALLPFLDKNENVYWDTLGWIQAGELENGVKIGCTTTYTVPKLFNKFYKTYRPIYKKAESRPINSSDGL